jgi:hypothetical protein
MLVLHTYPHSAYHLACLLLFLPPSISDPCLDPNETRYQAPGHLLLDLKLRAPSRTMSCNQHFDIQFLKRLHCGLKYRGLCVSQMVTTYNWESVAGKSEGVECGIYEAGVGTSCEEDEAFVCIQLSVKVLEVRMRKAVSIATMSSRCPND